MKPELMTGVFIVNLALISYTIATILLYKKKTTHPKVLIFFTVGVIFDIAATILMIMGSSKGMVTAHGVVGYSSLAAMLFETISLWRLNAVNGKNSEIPLKMRKISYAIYTWWILAYITGAVIVSLRH